jgi:hypothetical protein
VEIEVPTNSVATVREAGFEKSGLDVVHEREVPVAGDHHRVADPGLDEVVDDPLADRRIAVPGVMPVDPRIAAVVSELGHQRLVGEHVPAGV